MKRNDELVRLLLDATRILTDVKIEKAAETVASAKAVITSPVLTDGGLKLPRQDGPAIPKDAIYLVAPHGKWIADGSKTLMIKARRFDIAGKPLVIASDKLYGVVIFGEPKQIDLQTFEALRGEHKISDAERRKWWPDAKTFWKYPVNSVRLFDAPIAYDLPRGVQTFIRDVWQYAKKQVAKLTIGEINPETLGKLPDQEILSLNRRTHQLYGAFFAGNDKTSADALSRESLINAQIFLIDEMKKRGIEVDLGTDLNKEAEAARKLLTQKKASHGSQYAAINPSGANDGPPVQLEEILPHYEKPMLIRSPAVFLVGSTTNKGQGNDIDILIEGPLDEHTRHVLQFRLGRALPPKLSQRIQFHDEQLGGPFTCHVPLYDLALIPHRDRRVIEMVEKQADPYLEFPPEANEKHPAVFQLHFRGKSAHADLRIQIGPRYLIGWTISLAKAGEVPDVDTLEAGRSLSGQFDVEGSRWNKPILAPDKLFAVPKPRHPVEWLKLKEQVIEPGTVGATRFEEGVFVILDKCDIEWGMQKPYFHEYFPTGSEFFNGVLYFRQLVGREAPAAAGVEEGRRTEAGKTFWNVWLSKEYLPTVLKKRQVDRKAMPPDGQSAMPKSLMEQTPEQFRFWNEKGEAARKIRDALVAEKFFTQGNLELVRGEIRRVEKKRSVEVPSEKPTTFTEHAEQWVKERGLLDPDSDYDGMLGQAVLRMAKLFSDEGHSGMSARFARAYFNWLCDAYDGLHTMMLNDEDFEKAKQALAKFAIRHSEIIEKLLEDDGIEVEKRGRNLYEPRAEWLERAGKRTKFALSWQWFKGQAVIRAAPSRQVWHLAIDRPDGVEVFTLVHNPLGGDKQITATRSKDKTDEILEYEGEVEPGQKVGGTIRNETKATPSRIEQIDSGNADLLEDGDAFKKIRFDGKELKGVWVLAAEEPGGPIWSMSKSEGVGKSLDVCKAMHRRDSCMQCSAKPTVECRWAEGRARAWFCDGHWQKWRTEGDGKGDVDYFRWISSGEVGKKYGEAPENKERNQKEPNPQKAVSKAEVPTKDGVQIWDPENRIDDVDRTDLEPLAIFQPMKPASANEFKDLEEASEKFGTEAALAGGVYVEPKWNGFRIVAEKKGDRVLIFTEDRKRDISANLPGVTKDLKAIDEDFILDTEFMEFLRDGSPVPRRELAEFRGKKPVDDSNVRLMTFHVLYTSKDGNLTDEQLDENRKKLAAFFKRHKSKHLGLTEAKLAKTEEQLGDAVDWASKVPGSEGAMFKHASSTYTLGGQTSSWGKLKKLRTVRAIIYDRNPVKDAPGVYNFLCAIGPIPEKDKDRWKETVEVNGKLFTPIGRTFNSKLAAKPGDSVEVEITEMVVDQSAPKWKITWFTPMVVGKSDTHMTVAEIVRLAEPSEVKKYIRLLPVEKANEDERIVFGIVLEPDTVDSQGDTVTAEEIAQAAHEWLARKQNRGVMHRELANGKIEIYESYIAPQDLTIGGQRVKKGSWLLMCHILCDKLWAKIKSGELEGYSMGGFGRRIHLQAA